MDKISFFILNIFLNSLLSFFTVLFLIEGIIFLFMIPQGRVAAILRMVPILKLPLDICLYDFSRWSYAHGINPWNCDEGTRTLSAMIGGISQTTDWVFLPLQSAIQFTVPGNMTFTLADILGYSLEPAFLKILILFFMTISAGVLCTKFIKYYQSMTALKSLAKIAQPSNRTTGNLFLISCLAKHRLQILTLPNLGGSPFVSGLLSHSVYVPEQLLQTLSPREYEAVLAHEMEHIRYKDIIVRSILDLIGTLFWWVPTQWLHRRIEEGQEIGCDLKCQKYEIEPTDLAAAICKSVRYSKDKPTHLFARHLTKNAVSQRIEILLQPASSRLKKMRFACSVLALGVAYIVILAGRFWIF